VVIEKQVHTTTNARKHAVAVSIQKTVNSKTVIQDGH